MQAANALLAGVYSAQEIDYLRALKRIFDPNGILNPGKIFDSAPTRS